MTSCMWLYAFLEQSLSDKDIDENNAYAEWIETYSAPDFEALAGTLKSRLTATRRTLRPVMHAAYRRAMSLELAFFEACTGERPDKSE